LQQSLIAQYGPSLSDLDRSNQLRCSRSAFFRIPQLALQRMADLLREGLKPPEQLRRSTRPTRASVKRRLQGKKRRSDVKQNRKPPSSLQD